VRPLVAKGTEVIPTGTNRFLTSERGFFYFEIYEPPLRSRLSLRVRVLKRANGTQLDDSGPLSAADFVRPDNPVVPVAMVMPIASAGLPPGAYRLEVSVMQGGGQDPVIRSTDFEVR